jgi:hypothetical protein
MRTSTQGRKMRTTSQQLCVPAETLYCRPVSSHMKFDFWSLNRPDTGVWVEIMSNRELWQNVRGDPPFGHMNIYRTWNESKRICRRSKVWQCRRCACRRKKTAQKSHSVLKGAISMPDISQTKQGGSPYTQWRFGIAMAGAPDFPHRPQVHLLVILCWPPTVMLDLTIINAAAKSVGAGEVKKLTDNRSTEADWVNKTSPVTGFGGYAR